MATAFGALYVLSAHRWSDFPPTARQQILAFVGVAAAAGFMSVGALIVSRRPRHRMGWIFLATGLALLAAEVVGAYARAGIRHDAFGQAFGRAFLLPGQTVAAWFAGWMGTAAAGALILFFPLLFPNGRIPSKRWRPLAWFLGLVAFASVVIDALAPGPTGFDSERGPLAIEALKVLKYRIQFLGSPVAIYRVVFTVGAVLATAAMVTRFVTTPRDRRPALRGFAITTALLGLIYAVVLARTVSGWGAWPDRTQLVLQTAAPVLIVGLAIATLHAIFRHRLFEIDVVIRRTAIFGGTALLLSLVYAAATIGVSASTGRQGWLFSVAATGAVGAGLYPVRERAERLAHRVVYGERLESRAVFALAARRLAEVPAAEGPKEIARLLGEGLRPERVAVRIHAQTAPITYDWSSTDLPGAPDDERVSTRVSFGGTHVGEIELARRRDDSVTEQDRRVLAGVADLSAPAFANTLTLVELERRAEDVAAQAGEIAASRRRLSAAQLDTRTRFQLELDDRVQSRLSRLVATIRTIGVDTDVGALLDRTKAETETTLAELREIGRGLASSVLEERGLVAALRSLAQETSPGAIVVAHDELPDRRLDRQVEQAVFFAIADLFKSVEQVGSLQLAFADRRLLIRTELARSVPGSVRQAVSDRVGSVGGSIAFGEGADVEIEIAID